MDHETLQAQTEAAAEPVGAESAGSEPGPSTERRRRLPPWLKRRLPAGSGYGETQKVLKDLRMNTICVDGQCPNIWECWSHRVATFMILGNVCTRRCTFCAVAGGIPEAVDPDEPRRLAQACRELNLQHVVITSVDRDDLEDGGAGQFLACIREIRRELPGVTIETLTPDFFRVEDRAVAVLKPDPPEVWAHNIETVPRLYPEARRGSNYRRSLALLQRIAHEVPCVIVKSGMMLGLGETHDEVVQVLEDLRAHGVGWVTIGQYLRPNGEHHEVIRFVPPEEFVEYEKLARNLGFQRVQSSPFTRSSYHSRL